MEDKMKLTIEINNKQPVELTDLAKSMMSVADEYLHFLAEHDAHIEADDVKLYVKEFGREALFKNWLRSRHMRCRLLSTRKR